MYDVIIVGGGPAGLSAALLLGRCRRRVLVVDAGHPRNARSTGLHGFLSRDGILPAELTRLGREQLAPYGVELRAARVEAAECLEPGFAVRLTDGTRLESRALLLATGVVDRLPPIPGLSERFGRSVFHCPYCDGWEWRDQPLAVYGRGRAGAELALSLATWSRDIALVTDGGRVQGRQREELERHAITVRSGRIARLEGSGESLERIVFADGTALERRGLFLATGHDPASDLARTLGCRVTRQGAVLTNRREGTAIAGLYVVGDASRDVQFAIVAAAEGARAAVAIHRALDADARSDSRGATGTQSTVW